MKKATFALVGFLSSVLVLVPLSLAQSAVTDPVTQAQGYTTQYLKDAESYYKNGQCDLVKTVLSSINDQITTSQNATQGFTDLAQKYVNDGNVTLSQQAVDMAKKQMDATNVYLAAGKTILNSYSTPCKEGASSSSTQQTQIVQPTPSPTPSSLPPSSTLPVLSDIAGNKNQTAIQYLFDNKVISGYPDGTFKPNNTVNRAELLKILVGGKGVTPTLTDSKNCFPDVKQEWFAPYVCYAKAKNWVGGYPDGTFQPNKAVTKAEAIKMLVNSQGYQLPTNVTNKPYNDVDVSQWYAPFLKVAKDKGLLEETGNFFGVLGEMTRAGISENIYRAMIIKAKALNSFSDYNAQTSVVTPHPTTIQPTPTPVAPPTPPITPPVVVTPPAPVTIAPFTITGNGQTASAQFPLKKGLSIFNMQHSGESNFIVHLLDSNGNGVGGIANEIGNFNGSQSLSIPSDGSYLFNVQADGAWSINVTQPRPTTAAATTSFSGKGPSVSEIFSLSSGLHTFELTHDGESNFIVHVLDNSGVGVSGGSLVNEIGNFSGSTAVHIDKSGLYLLNVQADGNWTVKIN